jgi:hypothetical protein
MALKKKILNLYPFFLYLIENSIEFDSSKVKQRKRPWFGVSSACQKPSLEQAFEPSPAFGSSRKADEVGEQC